MLVAPVEAILCGLTVTSVRVVSVKKADYKEVSSRGWPRYWWGMERTISRKKFSLSLQQKVAPCFILVFLKYPKL